MMRRTLQSMIRGCFDISVRGPSDVEISGLCCDSRDVTPGDLFFAHPGQHTDGHRFVDDAIRRGAAAIVHSSDLPRYEEPVAYVKVPETYRAASALADAFFGRPSRGMTMVGVTGTDGKSSTVWYTDQLLCRLGVRSGFVSTVWIDTGGGVRKNPLRKSTPESMEVQRFLAEMRESGCGCAIVEATSHGLSERYSRLADVAFDIGVMTNVTHEHLEFHGSFESYRSDKANLFRSLGGADKSTPVFGVVNADDPSAGYFGKATNRSVYTYSILAPEADIRASDLRAGLDGTDFLLHTEDEILKGRINIPGAYNVSNVLAATLVVHRGFSVPVERIVPLYPQLRSVRGRMEVLDLGQPFRVIVDYAHTPGSFEKVFAMIKPMTPGRIIAVFGSAGERDLEKRPLQGRAACRYAEVVIVADEDPRGEDRMKILEEIAAGCTEKKRGADLLLIPDRREAIRTALALAEPSDTVLCLGKGHEQSIIYADGPIPWDEVEITRELLKERFGK